MCAGVNLCEDVCVWVRVAVWVLREAFDGKIWGDGAI